MFVEMIRRRLWRERNFMAVLVVAMSMVTAFLALSPLYVQLISSSEFDARLPTFNNDNFKVEAQSSTLIDAADIVQQAFDDWVTDIKISATTELLAPGQSASGSYSSELQMRAVTYHDFDTLFTLVEGRLPESTDDPAVIEAVITRNNWEEIRALNPNRATTELGFRHPLTETTSIEIVGIVEAIYPATDLYWERREDMLASVAPGAGPGDQDVLFFNVITTEAIFNDEVAQAVPVLHYWEIELDKFRINADALPEIEDRIQDFRTEIQRAYPLVIVRADLDTIISDFYTSIRETERPIILLSALIIAVMLYNIVNISTMILDEQHTEWAVIRSRGGSSVQLIGIHAISMALLGIMSLFIGPLLAWLIMVILSQIGPQADILETPQLSNIPLNSWVLSGVAAIAAVFIVTLPAFSLARKDLLTLKRSASRPPVSPAWARFYVDILMLLIGGAFLLRLYSLVGGEPLDLLLNPSALTGEVNLNDPFNLIGPALLIAGGALLWMRIFPMMVRGINFLIQRLQNLSANLALWNVERDPGQYAQLVLLMIGTLAIGTASLSLSHTRDSGAWETARQITGNDVQINFTPNQLMDWSSLPDVAVSMSLVKVELEGVIADRPLYLIGLDLEQAQQFPLIQDAIAPLYEAATPTLPGYTLPADTTQLAVEILVTSAEEINQTTTSIFFEFRNQQGIKLTLPGHADNVSLTDEFMTFTVETPPNLTFTGIQFDLSRDDLTMFEAVVHLDNLRAINAAGEETLISSFESVDDWTRSPTSERVLSVLNLNVSSNFNTQGENSLRVLQARNKTRSALPAIEFLASVNDPMPVIISADFADAFGQRRRLGRALQPGDEGISEITVFRTSESYSFNYHVEGVVDDFPTMPDNGIYIITLIDPLLYQINANQRPANAYDLNTAWLNLNTREPSTELKAALQGMDVNYAWDVYSQLQRDPLPNAITGILFAGFWVSLALILINFTFYQAVSARQRAATFAVLQAIGWERNRLWRMLTVENATFITPALIIGVILGIVISYLILPFMALIGGQMLKVPVDDVLMLLIVLVVCFSLLLSITVIRLQRIKPNEALRVIE